MGKYTKMALVLLYLLQLVIVFRDQLTHLYRSAMESVRSEAGQQAALPRAESGLRAVFERVVQIRKPGAHATLAAAASVAATGAILSGGESDGGAEVHHDDDRKDRARKHRHRLFAGFLLRNLWSAIRRSPAAPSALSERVSDIIRVTLFPDASIQSPA